MDPAELAGMRREYTSRPLDIADLDPDPLVAFRRWFDEVVEAGADDANAMALATADADGVPSVRHVLLKGSDRGGLTFFTSRVSAKAADLAANPHAALAFRWRALERQVTARGPVDPVADDEADAYFATRPRLSQIGAWASQQSAVIPDRAHLEASAASADARFADGPVPRPPFWGGYRLVPVSMEFWQGRPNRLHDRIRFRRDNPDAPWTAERLAP